jgi:hypothetical protein
VVRGGKIDKMSIFSDKKSVLGENLIRGPLKRLLAQYDSSKTINLGGGLPMQSCFPFTSAIIYTTGKTNIVQHFF